MITLWRVVSQNTKSELSYHNLRPDNKIIRLHSVGVFELYDLIASFRGSEKLFWTTPSEKIERGGGGEKLFETNPLKQNYGFSLLLMGLDPRFLHYCCMLTLLCDHFRATQQI